MKSCGVYLNHVLLDTLRIMASENGQQFIVGYEEESWKCVPLGIKIIVQAFLAFLQAVHQTLHRLQPASSVTSVQYFGVLRSFVHNLENDWKKSVRIFMYINIYIYIYTFIVYYNIAFNLLFISLTN